MKPALLCAATALCTTLAIPQVTPEQATTCAEQGGCVTATRQALERAMREAFQAGKAEGESRRCWRPA